MEEHAREIGVGKLEVPFVVELQESRTVGVVFFQVQVMNLWLSSGVAAVFANVHLKIKERLGWFSRVENGKM